MRLRRSDPTAPGYARRRRGRGFSYVDEDGRPLRSQTERERCQDLVIPPAWRDVWISTDPRGHIQATGVDAAGRRQYLYHPAWRAKRDAAKFDHVLEVARRLPRLRQRVAADLDGTGLGRQRVLATAARLLDHGLFRVGGDQYAAGDEGTFGLATLQVSHVRFGRGEAVFSYRAKGGAERVCAVADPEVRAVLRSLCRAREVEERLFAFRDARQWRELRSDDINEYLRHAAGCDITAKDFRTWHATVVAAAMLASEEPGGSETRRKRVVARVMREVAEELGNTPAVARASYVDPRVVDRFHEGTRIPAPGPVDGFPAPAAVERAVLRLLTE
jgi:DNA topoisomerase IB